MLKLQFYFYIAMSFCVGILTNTYTGGRGVWLGGSDEKIEGNWLWTDGSRGNLF